MNPLFQPKDKTPRWKVCYDLVVSKEPGDEILYTDFFYDHGWNRATALQAMNEANRRLLRDGHNSVRNIQNTGWLILSPNDAVPLIGKQRKKAERADDRVFGRINNAQKRRDELTPEKRAEVDHQQMIALRKAEINGRRRLDTRELLERASREERPRPLER